MSKMFGLPCGCGKEIAVSAAQAGQIASCGCGAQLAVPNFGELRKLRVLNDSTSDIAEPWNPVRGGMFVLGVLLSIIGVGIAYYGWDHARKIDTTDHTSEQLSAAYAELDRLPASEMIPLWNALRRSDLTHIHAGPHVRARSEFASYRNVGIGGVAMILAGITSAALSVMNTNGQRKS